MKLQSQDIQEPLSKSLFFSEATSHPLLDKDKERKLFERYDLELSSWIAKLLMISSAAPHLLRCFQLEGNDDYTQGLIRTIRWRYPCNKRLSKIHDRIILERKTTKNIRADLDESKRAIRQVTEEIVNANIGLVIKVAKQYNFLKLPLMDLIQEGFIGLLTAVEKFNLEQGNRFSTYAWWWIKQSIVSYSRKQGGIVRRPESLVDLIIKLSPYIAGKEQMASSQLANALSKELELDENKVNEAISVKHSDLSIDYLSQESENQTNWADKHLQYCPSETLVTSKQLTKLLDTIPERLRQVLILRFGINQSDHLTRGEIGKILGIGAERVRQLEVKALSYLHDYIS